MGLITKLLKLNLLLFGAIVGFIWGLISIAMTLSSKVWIMYYFLTWKKLVFFPAWIAWIISNYFGNVLNLGGNWRLLLYLPWTVLTLIFSSLIGLIGALVVGIILVPLLLGGKKKPR